MLDLFTVRLMSVVLPRKERSAACEASGWLEAVGEIPSMALLAVGEIRSVALFAVGAICSAALFAVGEIRSVALFAGVDVTGCARRIVPLIVTGRNELGLPVVELKVSPLASTAPVVACCMALEPAFDRP
jgi:hypothetical protein